MQLLYSTGNSSGTQWDKGKTTQLIKKKKRINKEQVVCEANENRRVWNKDMGKAEEHTQLFSVYSSLLQRE